MAGLGYLQARVQARFAQLPDETLWRELEGAGDLAGYLRAAKEGMLAPWVQGLSPRSDSDEIEARLAKQLTSLIDESAQWCDEAWRPSVLGLKEWLNRLEHPAQLSEVVIAWRERLPAHDLESLEKLLADHRRRFMATPPRQTRKLRHRLAEDLQQLFRRSICRPSVVFVWLALAGLTAERLRGDLLLRALYSEGDAPFREAA